MSYEACEAAVKTLLNADAVFKERVTIDDANILNSGTPHAVILRYGGFQNIRLGFRGSHQITWTINCNLYVRYKDDKQVRDDLRDARTRLLAILNKYPTLNNPDGTMVLNSLITSGTRNPEYAVSGSARFFEEVLVLTVSETEDIDYEGLDHA